MRLLTALLSCAMALFGCDTRPATTSITRVVEHGTETLFSKTTLVDGIASFECFASTSGGCHYRIYEASCPVAAAGDAGTQCEQRLVDRFDLAVGRRHEVRGLPHGFRHCVATGPEAPCMV